MPTYHLIGVDLGQSRDYTAIAVLRKSWQEPQPVYHGIHLERLPLGTRYPAIVARLRQLVADPQLRENQELVVDATGVGTPVLDMLHYEGLYASGVMITGGLAESSDGEVDHVPKRNLVSTLQLLMQSGRLKFAADLRLADQLIEELTAFQVSLTPAGNDTYGVWREGKHDDLVLAAAIAAWKGENVRYLDFV
jgi:hypothetical protein